MIRQHTLANTQLPEYCSDGGAPSKKRKGGYLNAEWKIRWRKAVAERIDQGKYQQNSSRDIWSR